MSRAQGITVPIYKIDADAVADFLGLNLEDISLAGLPVEIVRKYNADKHIETYQSQGDSIIGGCRFELFRNIVARPNTSSWVPFFRGSGIELDEITNQMQHLVCFVVVDDALYAYTAGQAAVIFERFIDISFPIEVGRRIAKPEVKGARSSQITGSTLTSNVHFRDPRRITYAESLENVWTALSGQLRGNILEEQALTSVFGVKAKMTVDVTSSLKLGPRIASPEKLVGLIRWLAAKVESPLPADDEWAVLDAIKVLNPRKKKDLIAHLKTALAEKIFASRDYANVAVSHIDASLYDNATGYIATQGKNLVYDSDERPTLAELVENMEIEAEDIVANLTSINIRTENSDYGAGHGTSGPLLSHLYGEVRFDGKTYFLLAGKWYEVDAVYIDQITKDFISIMADLDIDPSEISLSDWAANDREDTYNETSVTAPIFVNGDKVLTDNVELFDGLASDGLTTYVIHVKRNFDVKVRDVRSQVVNSAQIIENDLRSGARLKLREHHARLISRQRTSMSEGDFLQLFELPRVYVFAYGSGVKVSQATLSNFGSCVARMEVVSLNNQFRQISSAESQARLRIAWVKIV